eukprot:1143694-Pelagomonas_calceolata.AAC.1
MVSMWEKMYLATEEPVLTDSWMNRQVKEVHCQPLACAHANRGVQPSLAFTVGKLLFTDTAAPL